MHITRADVEKSIQAIHAAPHMVVIEFAGAGSQALAWLHGVAGSSRTILEATDRYVSTSLINLLGFEPTQFTSPQVARAMATKAYIRARQLAPPGTPVAGIGSTATIATDRAKRGDHRCCVAVCDAQGVTSYALTLTKGLRTRQQEESLVSLLILRAVAGVCGVEGLPTPTLVGEEAFVEQFEPTDLLARLLAREVGWVAVTPDDHMTTGETLSHIALLSGSFNPIHQGHRKLAEAAAKILGQDVYFELTLVNADKAQIDLGEARRRIAQFSGQATVLLTCAPLFSQKAQLFPHSVFVLGIDTVERLIQPRFYNNNPAEMLASFKAIRTAGCHFLVAGRLRGHHFLTLQDLDLPAGYRELFEEIPDFRMDISSTAIREKNMVH
jgi:nicotinic acid mononucleotide adenylyltransferase